jgi:transposase
VASRRGRRPRRLGGVAAPDVAVRRWSRAERLEQIETLEREGLSAREIGERLDLSPKTVRAYRADPERRRELERRERYRGRCRRCGRPTSGAGGKAAAPPLCAACTRELARVWTDERIVAAIRDWQQRGGEPPTVSDWSPAQAPAEHRGSQRYQAEPERWPSAALLRRRFGSFGAALEAAGFARRAPGARRQWSEAQIVAAIRDWQQRTGEPPRPSEWRHAGERHPAASTVYRVLGSWRRALEAAG